MGEVIKSGVAATFPLQGEVQSQPKGGEKGGDTPCTPPPPPPPSIPPPPVPPPSPPPRAWGVWGWVGARALDASLWTLRSGRGHLACLHNGIISVPASATAAVSTSRPSASTSCPWRSSTNCPPSRPVLKRSGAAGRQSCLWVAFLGIAQCVCWLLCAEQPGSGVSLNHRDGRYIYVSTLR